MGGNAREFLPSGFCDWIRVNIESLMTSLQGGRGSTAVQSGYQSMSALGQERTFRIVRLMSALPPKADIDEDDRSCAKSRHPAFSFNQP